jgi:plastocyanin
LKRHLIASIVAAAAMLAVPTAASAVTITVEPAPFDNGYSPQSATIDLGGGSFDWEWGPGGAGADDLHNVIEGDGFGSGRPLFNSGEAVADLPGGFSVTASAGSFPYYCEVHFGMVGDVAVRPVGEPRGEGVRVTWASAETTTGNRFDVRYKAGKKWKSWKKKVKKTGATFGRNGKPAKLGNKAVELQARSRAGKARSDWSPTVKLEK